ETEPVNNRGMRFERAETDQRYQRGHDERNGREEEHDRRRSCRNTVEFLPSVLQPADVAGEAEDQKKIPDDAPRNRRFNDLRMMRAKRDDRDNQLGGIAERRVEKAAEGWSRSACEVLGRNPDQAGSGNERNGGGNKYPD